MTIINDEAVLTRLGLVPNEALLKQLDVIKKNTPGYEKIIKHILDLHDALKVDKAYVAMSNSNNYFKIKFEEVSPEIKEEIIEKIKHFEEKYKVILQKVENKETYYIKGFHH
jgi:uncharacterized membrane protein